MEYSFRWYGPNDTVPLGYIRQANATGIVTSLHQIKTGEAWSNKQIKERINYIKKFNTKNSIKLKWNVVESIPVHNNIKLKKGNFKLLIENYKKTITNISKNNIRNICYNFMPIVDWTRTQLNYKMPTDGIALRFDLKHLIIFEKFFLKIKNLEARYNHNEIIEAEKEYKKLNKKELNQICFSIMGGLPAAETKYHIKSFKKMLDNYKDLTAEGIRENLSFFIKEIMPIAEEKGINMNIHPDDPPFPLFGVPRIVSNLEDYKFIMKQYNSTSNGITFCTGSLASNIKNDVYKFFKTFSSRINFIHLRNVSIEKDKKSFVESDHLNGRVNLVKIIKMILKEENKRKKSIKNYQIPMRPDHGHCLLDDQNKKINPGYSAIGRLKGLAEIRGIAKALENY